MRYMMISFGVLAMLFSQDLFASAKTDSIVTFLGGAHAKFVWPRWAWCNDNYTPKTQAAAKAEGISLMLMDTRTGTERALVTGMKKPSQIRISRSGKWATVADNQAKKSYIVDLTARSPALKVLLDFSAGCAYFWSAAWWIDPANGTEYVYAVDNVDGVGCSGIYKVKINADGTASLPGTKLTINSTPSLTYPSASPRTGRSSAALSPGPTPKFSTSLPADLTRATPAGSAARPIWPPITVTVFFIVKETTLAL